MCLGLVEHRICCQREIGAARRAAQIRAEAGLEQPEGVLSQDYAGTCAVAVHHITSDPVPSKSIRGSS